MPAGTNPTAEAELARAIERLYRTPDDAAAIVWVGRRLGYLWRINEAVETYTAGIKEHPAYAPLYRHRGHRYITLRRFDQAVADLEQAAELIRGRPDEIEPDGQPNARNIPLTTLAFNVWYHLGLAHYLKGDFDHARRAYEQCMAHSRGCDDNLCATTHWLYMTLRRLGQEEEAEKLLDAIHADMDLIENTAYHRLLLMYKGQIEPSELLAEEIAPAQAEAGRAAAREAQQQPQQIATSRPAAVDRATLGYGLGNWLLYNGQPDLARVEFERAVAAGPWPAFGCIAAEVELARMGARAVAPLKRNR